MQLGNAHALHGTLRRLMVLRIRTAGHARVWKAAQQNDVAYPVREMHAVHLRYVGHSLCHLTSGDIAQGLAFQRHLSLIRR